MDRADLYRTILAHDHDVATQLVLADALQEQGDARGRLLAVQHALELDPWNAELQREEVALIDRNAEALLGPLSLHRYDDGLELQWARGFVRGAALDEKENPASRLLDELLRIPAVEALSSLRIGQVREPHGCTAVLLARRPSLTRLVVGIDAQDRRVFEDAFLEDLWEALPGLESLVIGGGWLGDLRLPQLRSFDLRCAPRWDLSPLIDAHWPRLTSLRLAGASVSPYSQLGDRFVDPSDVRTLIDALAELPALRSFSLVDSEDLSYGWGSDSTTTAADLIVEHVAGSQMLGRLGRLEVGGQLSARGVAQVLERAARFAHLDELVLGEPECDAETRARLARVAKSVRLGSAPRPTRR